MIIAYWNALRVGDALYVHDDIGADEPTRAARVAIVDASVPRHQIGVRFDDDDGDSVAWPNRLRVHFAERDLTDQCRWCIATTVGVRA